MSCDDSTGSDCGEVLQRVFEFLDGEMGPQDAQRIRIHLDECRGCMTEYDVDVAMKALLRRSLALEPAPDHLRSRIMIRITEVEVQLRG